MTDQETTFAQGRLLCQLREALLFAVSLAVLPANAVGESAVVRAPQSRAQIVAEQREDKARNLEPERPTGIEKKLLYLKDHQVLQRFGPDISGVWPLVGSAATGQGFGLGARYRKDFGPEGEYILAVDAIGTTAKAWRTDLGVAAPRLAADRIALDFHARHRDLTQLDFYGLGPDSGRTVAPSSSKTRRSTGASLTSPSGTRCGLD